MGAGFGLVVLLLISSQCLAEPAPTSERLKQTQSRIKQLETRIKIKKDQERVFINELAAIEKKYGQLALTQADLAEQLKQQQRLLVQLQSAIVKLRQQVREQSRELAGQIRSAYVIGRQERLKVLFNQQDPVRASRLLKYFDYFNNARLQRREHLMQGVVDLAASEQHQQEVLQTVEVLTERNQAERLALKKTGGERQKLLDQLLSDVNAEVNQLAQLRENEVQLQQLLQRLKRQSVVKKKADEPFAGQQGRLNWPLAGKLIRRFGSQRVNSRWDGVLIKAKTGVPVRAVNAGRVVYADWLRGYGLLTIIDHGQGFMSLYAFAQSLHKAVGDHVSAGEVIANVGRSGGRTESALYFGIRKQGRPVDPQKWCKKIRNGQTS